MVGVALTTEGECGAGYGITAPPAAFTIRIRSNAPPFSRTKNYGSQSKRSQRRRERNFIITLRQSVLKLTGDVMNDDPRELQLYPLPDA